MNKKLFFSIFAFPLVFMGICLSGCESIEDKDSNKLIVGVETQILKDFTLPIDLASFNIEQHRCPIETRAKETSKTLYKGVLDFSSIQKELGASGAELKVLNLKEVKISVIVPAGFDVSIFHQTDVFAGKNNKLIASSVGDGNKEVISFTIKSDALIGLLEQGQKQPILITTTRTGKIQGINKLELKLALKLFVKVE